MLGVLTLLVALAAAAAGSPGEWQSLAPGMELGTFAAGKSTPLGDARITVLRIDPKLWDLDCVGVSWTGESEGKTARQWCESHGFAAAINAGMFASDYKTHIGYLRSGGHVNSDRVNGYRSVAAFDPKAGDGLPQFRIFDLDAPGTTVGAILRDFGSVVQNLRLIKRPGTNQWSQQANRWSEAALGEDAAGRALFIFSRSPFTMHDLNLELLSMGIDLVAAQHLEGGPEAQLYVRIGDLEYEMFGSYETSFRENDETSTPWPIPNVIGVRPRSPAND
jgi:hypothetical protein